MSAFEVITEEEYKSGVSTPLLSSDSRMPEDSLDTPEKLTWCKFCKGYYHPEYHFGEEGGDTNSDDSTT